MATTFEACDQTELFSFLIVLGKIFDEKRNLNPMGLHGCRVSFTTKLQIGSSSFT